MTLVVKKSANSYVEKDTQEQVFIEFYQSMNILREQTGRQVIDRNNQKAVQLLRDVELDNKDERRLLSEFISGDIDLCNFKKDSTFKGLVKSLSDEFGSTELRFKNVLVGLCFRSAYTKCVDLRSKII